MLLLYWVERLICEIVVKSSKIWMAENLVRSGHIGEDRVLRKTLKDLCEETKIPYGTAKRRQDRDGKCTSYVLDDGKTWVVWREVVR